MREGTPFSDLFIGDTFDFINPNKTDNRFLYRCRKISSIGYVYNRNGEEIKCLIHSPYTSTFHVERTQIFKMEIILRG